MHRGCVPVCNSGIPARAPYFNSGVIVISVTRFRDENIGEKAFRYALEFVDKLNYADQDVLNATLYGYWKALEPRWNQVSGIHWDHGFVHCHMNTIKLAELRKGPWIINYTGGLPRPWVNPHGHPLASGWLEIYKLTEFSGCTVTGHLENKAAKLFNRLRRAFSILLHG